MISKNGLNNEGRNYDKVCIPRISWAGFVGTDDKAHVAGDIVMNANEVNPIIQLLRKGGIEVVAVHNHMLTEQPRVLFLHYWGSGPAESLAKGVKAAFDQLQGPIK